MKKKKKKMATAESPPPPPTTSTPASTTEPPLEERKSEGARRDFEGTWILSIPMHELEEKFAKWVSANVNPEHLQSEIPGMCKGGIVTDQSASVLLGIPRQWSTAQEDCLGSLVETFTVKFGPLSVFRFPNGEPETETVRDAHGVLHSYDVMHVPILNASRMDTLQKIAGRIAVTASESPVLWHHKIGYRKHLTSFFVQSKFRHVYEGKRIIDEEFTLPVDRVVLKAFRNKKFLPRTIMLRNT